VSFHLASYFGGQGVCVQLTPAHIPHVEALLAALRALAPPAASVHAAVCDVPDITASVTQE
jgi:hypothetical protein